MRRRITSILLAGMMILNSVPAYADVDISGADVIYEESSDGGNEGNTENYEHIQVSADEESTEEFADSETYAEPEEQETEEDQGSEDTTGLTDVFTDEQNAQAVQNIEDTKASDGTLQSGIKWELSEAGSLHITGSGAIQKDSEGNYPWDKEKITSINIENGVTEIGSEAFADCVNLLKVSIAADTLQTVSEDAFANCPQANVQLYYSGNAPAKIPAFTGTAATRIYYREADSTWTEEYKAAYAEVEWIPCCTVNNLTANTDHAYVRDSNEIISQADGKNYPTAENMAYYPATCSVCENKGKEYNDCIHCIDTTDLQSDHPYNTETATDWTISMKGAEEIILTFDGKTQFETNYDDFFYIYDENGELYQKYINDQLAGKTVVVPGSAVTLRLTTDYSTDEWGFAVTRAYGTTHAWDDGVITKPAERDQTGIRKITCKKCNESVEEVIAAPYIVCGETDYVFWGITPDGVLEVAPSDTGNPDTILDYGSTGSFYTKTIDARQITNAPWGDYWNYIEGVKIKKGITKIGSYSFYGLYKLKWSEMEDNVRIIEAYAFQECTTLEKVDFSENLTSMGYGVFSGTSLKNVTIPKSLKKCAYDALGNNLESIDIEDLSQWLNLEEYPQIYSSRGHIDYYLNGEPLENLVIPENITGIRAYAFAYGQNIKTVTFHEKIEYIGENAFEGCIGLTQCLFAKDIQITKIPYAMFSQCTNLKQITIPATVVTIESAAFFNCCNLKTIQIPATVKFIGSSAFCDCSSLEEILFLGDFGSFNFAFGSYFSHPLRVTYYACNNTWNSSEAQAFFEYYSGYSITANPIHMSINNTIVTPATCTADGERSFVCDNCGQPFTEVIPASGHSLTQKEHKDATCQEKGYDIQVCSVCQEEFRTELDIDPTAHQYDEGKVIDPTCSRDGYTLYTCTRCGSTKREDYRPSTPHDYEDTIVKATCQTQGYTLHQCKNCDYSYYDTWTEPLEHDYETTVTAPTCTERGYTYYSCKNCGYSYRDNYVGASGHQYKKEVIAPTCTEEGYTRNICRVCGATYISNYREAKGHDYTSVVTAPTCTERGYTTYTCKNCDSVIVSDYRGVLGHSYEAQITDSTCTTEGFTTYTCVTCGNSYVGDRTDKAPHSWDKGTITKEPGYLANGTKEFHCKNCDASYTEDIPALEQTALKDCQITLSYRKTVYNGKEKTPKVTVKNSSGIISAADYTVTYADNLNAGDAKVIVTAEEGNVSVTGNVEIPFVITKAKQTITAACADERIHINTSTEIQADAIGAIQLTTNDNDKIKIKDTGITGKKAGLATVKVTASGDSNHESAETTVTVWIDENHTIQRIVENQLTLENGDIEYDDVQKCTLCGLEIKRNHRILRNINSEECEIRLSDSVYVYNGEAIKPEVSVFMNGTALTEGKDYRLEFKNNESAGEGTVSVIGMGDYTNAKEKTFQIIEKLDSGKIISITNATKGMKLTWQKIDGAQGYIIYRAAGKGSLKVLKKISNVKTLSYTDTSATTNGEKYTYAVCGYKGNVKGTYTKKSSYCLTPVKLLSVKNSSSKKATVKWKKNEKATGYQISYVTGKTQKTVTIKSNKTVSTVIKNLKKGSTYSVKIRGYKTVSGVTWYSEWCSLTKIKITK